MTDNRPCHDDVYQSLVPWIGAGFEDSKVGKAEGHFEAEDAKHVERSTSEIDLLISVELTIERTVITYN